MGDSMQADDGIRHPATTRDEMHSLEEQKAKIHATLDAVLDRLDELHGADAWEENCLVLALNYPESGLYTRPQGVE